jgi:uncharacterized membrane protein YeaQ/YmgE (transglycosylase-associated protein family)
MLGFGASLAGSIIMSIVGAAVLIFLLKVLGVFK